MDTSRIWETSDDVLAGLRQMLELMAKMDCTCYNRPKTKDCGACISVTALNRMGKIAVEAIVEIRREYPDFYEIFQEVTAEVC